MSKHYAISPFQEFFNFEWHEWTKSVINILLGIPKSQQSARSEIGLASGAPVTAKPKQHSLLTKKPNAKGIKQ